MLTQFLSINQRLKEEDAFTLLEIVVVIAIIGLLSSIAVPSFSNFSRRTKINVAKTNLLTILKECQVESLLNQDPNPNLEYISSAKRDNPYNDRYGITFGTHDGFTYDTSISSNRPARDNSSCMRISAKSTKPPGQGFLYPHFEVFYNQNTNLIEKTCIVGTGAYNGVGICDTKAPIGSQW